MHFRTSPSSQIKSQQASHSLGCSPTLKHSYSLGNWKKHIAGDLTRGPQLTRNNSDTTNHFTGTNNNSYHRHAGDHTVLSQSDIKESKKE
jgi:hypothetical protein